MSALLHPATLEDLERILVSFIYERYFGQTWKGHGIPPDLFKSFISDARSLSDAFTLDRRNLHPNYFRSKEARSAYLLYFHLANVVRTYAVLLEMNRRGLWAKKPLRILDLGAGTGASLWAAMWCTREFGGGVQSLEIWDREPSILQDAKILWERFLAGIEQRAPDLKTRVVDVKQVRPVKDRFDLVFMSNVVNEVEEDPVRIARMMSGIMANTLAPDGLMILLEPALLTVSRKLTAVRDAMLKEAPFAFPIPCGHQGNCPMNQEPKDWCNFEISWQSPQYRDRIERALEHRTGKLKYSYLVIQQPRPQPKTDAYRVLSNPITDPRGDLLLLCSPQQKIALHYDRKQEIGRVLDDCRRGDLLNLKISESDIATAPTHRYAKDVNASPSMNPKKI